DQLTYLNEIKKLQASVTVNPVYHKRYLLDMIKARGLCTRINATLIDVDMQDSPLPSNYSTLRAAAHKLFDGKGETWGIKTWAHGKLPRGGCFPIDCTSAFNERLVSRPPKIDKRVQSFMCCISSEQNVDKLRTWTLN